MRMAGSISKSTDVMKAMQNLIKIPEIQSSMMELSKEMAKVGSATCDWAVGRHCNHFSRMCCTYMESLSGLCLWTQRMSLRMLQL